MRTLKLRVGQSASGQGDSPAGEERIPAEASKSERQLSVSGAKTKGHRERQVSGWKYFTQRAKPMPSHPLFEGKQGESRFFDASDGARLFYRIWQGEALEPAVVYLHGIEGHGLWFAATAAWLNQRGLNVYAPDRRGAGRNVDERGHIRDYRILIDDIEKLLCELRARHREIFLIANCWSASAGILVASRAAPGSLNGLVLTSPAVATKVDLSLAEKFKVAYRWILRDERTLPIPISPQMFTDNADYLAFVKEDSVRLTEATASFFVETARLRFLAWQSAKRLAVPLLVLQAGKDQIVSVDGARRWFERAAAPDKTFQVLPEVAHSLDFHKSPDVYRQVLMDWIASRSYARSGQ